MKPVAHHKTDLLIIGAGCSGLALARELSERQWSGKVTLIDSRTYYQNDRTWCFWADKYNSWFQLARHRWYHWFMSSAEFPHQHYHAEDAEQAYCRVSGIDYYHFCLEKIKHNPQLSLCLGTQALDVGHCLSDNSYRIKTNRGIWQATTVVDTRPDNIKSAWLYQCFYGVTFNHQWYLQYSPTDELYIFGQALQQHYKTTYNEKAMGLMTELQYDAAHQGVAFQYHLPFAHQTSLLERTWFVPKPLSKQQAQYLWIRNICQKISPLINLQSEVLAKKLTEHWQDIAIETEYGCLPMGVRQIGDLPTASSDPLKSSQKYSDHLKSFNIKDALSQIMNIANQPQYIRGGIAGDLLRPSTGYGFLAIQDWAADTARRQLLNRLRKSPSINPYNIFLKHLTRILDLLFLRTLRYYPQQAPDIFLKIFRRTSSVEFIHFMSDRPQLSSWLRVIRAAPSRPFILTSLRIIGQTSRAIACRLRSKIHSLFRRKSAQDKHLSTNDDWIS